MLRAVVFILTVTMGASTTPRLTTSNRPTAWPHQDGCKNYDPAGGSLKGSTWGLVQNWALWLVYSINNDREFKNFMDGTTTCQHQCLNEVMSTSLQTLWATDLIRYQDQIVLAMTGAFRACYPRPPRNNVLNFIHTVVQRANQDAPSNAGAFTPKNPCNSQPSYAKQSEFQALFNTLNRDINHWPDGSVKDLIKSSKSCQMTCLNSAINQALNTAYADGNFVDFYAERLTKHALTGAFMSCYPNAPRNLVYDFVQMTTQNVGKTLNQYQSGSYRLRLYDDDWEEDLKKEVSAPGSAWSPVQLAVGAGVGLLVASSVVGLRALWVVRRVIDQRAAQPLTTEEEGLE